MTYKCQEMIINKDKILHKARALGFDVVGVTAPTLPERAVSRMHEFVEKGEHGDMQWMEDKMHLRADPKAIWPQVKSIVMLGHNYGPDYNPLDKLADKDRGLISAYALNRDYHDIMKKRMKELARWMCEEFSCDARVFVDTAPIMEKPLAVQAGLGWQGKHTCVVSRKFGNWLFLGEVFTDLELAPDEAEKEHCGSCKQCIDICP